MPRFPLRLYYRKRNPRLNQKVREAIFSGVIAASEKEARLALVQDYIKRGYRVLKIERNPDA